MPAKCQLVFGTQGTARTTHFPTNHATHTPHGNTLIRRRSRSPTMDKTTCSLSVPSPLLIHGACPESPQSIHCVRTHQGTGASLSSCTLYTMRPLILRDAYNPLHAYKDTFNRKTVPEANSVSLYTHHPPTNHVRIRFEFRQRLSWTSPRSLRHHRRRMRNLLVNHCSTLRFILPRVRRLLLLRLSHQNLVCCR
jgi:hypothetical protein